MIFFNDRQDAGKQLAQALITYKNNPDTLVLGLPRGGIAVAYEVAKSLNLPLDVICPIKIGAPTNKEYAIGAITESGEGVFNETEIRRLGISKSYLNETIATATQEVQNRMKVFRKNRPPLDFNQKNILIIDDGMATGLTMKASIASLRKMHASKIIVAVPVAPKDTIMELKELADEIICLQSPPLFYAVGQFYKHFGPTSIDDVIDLLAIHG